ncbi:M23 family metallopeptidase [Nocardioides solisilvae]|uniref:M23 family metallopeptidase n=1 Tax=Nocardioides solisilvae TaxID=1542435 RepID=UPI000D745F3A|nr:M23 family metallopeptidase [Nocardioides solisilvae]
MRRSPAPPSPAAVRLAARATALVSALVSVPAVVLAVVLAVAPVAAPAAAPAAEPSPGTWPLAPRPRVVAGFAPPVQRWQAGHRGVDLAGRPGQAVRAALAGRVSFAGRVAGKPSVVVDHGATRTTYEPVVALVSVGTEVSAGDRLGLLTLPFSHCHPAACLHWGLRRGTTYLDPLSLVARARVRLLPLGGAAATRARWRSVTPGDGPGGRRDGAGRS